MQTPTCMCVCVCVPEKSVTTIAKELRASGCLVGLLSRARSRAFAGSGTLGGQVAGSSKLNEGTVSGGGSNARAPSARECRPKRERMERVRPNWPRRLGFAGAVTFLAARAREPSRAR